MELNYKKTGENGEHLIILHGLFGMLDNWHTLAGRFSADFQVWALDARNHGKSPQSDIFDYDSMANDLLEFFNTHKIDKAYVMGHSMGGKTAMHFALMHPDLVSKLIVVDIAPKIYDIHGHDRELEALEKLDLKNISRRAEAEEAMAKDIPVESTRQFLLKNLGREGDHFVLKINLDAIKKNYEIIRGGIAEHGVFDKETLFITGEKSRYVLESDKPEIINLFPKAQFTEIANAGHWVHAEAPEAFYNAVVAFLK